MKSFALHFTFWIPTSAKKDKVRFRIRQVSAFSGQDSQVWSADNFLLASSKPLKHLNESFDPIDDCNWVTYAGAVTKV